MSSDTIKIDPAKGTLTIFVGKEPVVVVKTDESVQAANYAKLLRRKLLRDLVDHLKAQLADDHAGLGSGEKRKLSKVLKAFEKEYGSRRSK